MNGWHLRIGRALFLTLVLGSGLLSFSGCAPGRVAFTQSLREQYALSEEDLKNLQYYVSSDVTLQREFRSEEGLVSPTHRLVRKEGGLREEVILRSDTPGIAVKVGPTSLAVGFEPGASLVFGSPESDRDPERKYRLSAKRWEDHYGELEYGGKTWYAVEGSGSAHLTVDFETLDAVERKRKVLPGMKLPSK